MSDWIVCPSCGNKVKGQMLDHVSPYFGCKLCGEPLQENGEKWMRPEIRDPRWCDCCRLVVRGTYVSDGDKEWLVCARCGHHLSLMETPEETTEKARVRARPPEAPKTCVFCVEKIQPNEPRTCVGGTLDARYVHDTCFHRLLCEHGYVRERTAEKQ